MNYVLIAIWINSAGVNITITEVSSASKCYEAKAQIEKTVNIMRNTQMSVMCVKK